MPLYFYKRKFIAICIFIILFVSCVTTKKKGDLSTVGKIYHNTTARYNGYFNATELYKASRANLISQYQENYTKLLPLYPEMKVENSGNIAEDMDVAIKKLGVVINLHRTSKWTDDSYLLIGKAQFMKQDYQKAKETFAYLVDEFDPDNLNSNNRNITSAKSEKAKKAANKNRRTTKKKSSNSKANNRKSDDDKKARLKEIKQREKARKKARNQANKERTSRKPTPKETAPTPTTTTTPSSGTPTAVADAKATSTKNEEKKKEEEKNDGLFDHEPAYFEGMVWLARTNALQGYHLNANNIFTELRAKSSVSQEVLKEMEKARAAGYIQLEDYPSAIKSLGEAYALSNDKEEKARFAFILGQLQMETKDYTDAKQSFEKVLDGRGNYEMDFNAKLYLTKLGIHDGPESEKNAIATLEKMIKDQKNIEYRDQLYYTLAQIQLEKNNKPKAIEYLKQAVVQKSNNLIRKAESYYLLAELFYEDEIYINAKNYYDSTLQVLPPVDERYPRVQQLASGLTDIARHLETIARLDSFIKVSKLSNEEKRKLAMRIKKDMEKEAQIAANIAANDANQRSSLATNKISNPITTNTNSANASTFFAYDEKELKKGFRDFKSNWGNRALEDNWRRSLRSDANVAGIVAEDTGEEVESELIGQNEIEDILKDIPKNAQEVARMEDRIQESMFELGRLYRDKLEHYTKSAGTLEELLTKYENPYKKIETYYYLYLDYIDLGDQVNATKYYNLILEEAPDSEFAKVLKDPSYLNRDADSEMEVYRYYEDTYELFNQGKIDEACERVNQADELFKENPIKAKFAMLKAFCTGKFEGRDAYIQSLKDLVANYPKTPEQTHARELLRILMGGDPIAPKSSILKYVVEKDRLHYVVVILYEMNGSNTNKARGLVSDFNKKRYAQKEFKAISSLALDREKDIPMLIIRDFENAGDAMSYYDVIAEHQDEFLNDQFQYEVYAMSQRNYRELFKSKKIEEYKDFFEENYLK